MTKQWVNVELTYNDYKLFRAYLKDHNIYFETFGCTVGVHVEVLATSEEIDAANSFLDTL